MGLVGLKHFSKVAALHVGLSTSRKPLYYMGLMGFKVFSKASVYDGRGTETFYLISVDFFTFQSVSYTQM